MSSGSDVLLLPSGVFIVFGDGLEAAVQADEPVRELAQRSVVTDLPVSDLTVSLACSPACLMFADAWSALPSASLADRFSPAFLTFIAQAVSFPSRIR
jgi:hypothetical protein